MYLSMYVSMYLCIYRCIYFLETYGQRALVGKVNMDQNSPDFYIEEKQKSIKDTRE